MPFIPLIENVLHKRWNNEEEEERDAGHKAVETPNVWPSTLSSTAVSLRCMV